MWGRRRTESAAAVLSADADPKHYTNHAYDNEAAAQDDVITDQPSGDQSESSASEDPDVEEQTGVHEIQVKCAADSDSASDDEDASGGDLHEVTAPSIPRTCWHARHVGVCVRVSLALAAVLAGAALGVVLVLVAAPYAHVRGFTPATCVVSSSDTQPRLAACTCGNGCDSLFPCVRVTVSFRTADGGIVQNVTLHENEVTLGKKCSFYPRCQASRQENAGLVAAWAGTHGAAGAATGCLYNPRDESQVIRSRRFQLHHVIHGVVWTGGVAAAAVAALVAITVRRRRAGE